MSPKATKLVDAELTLLRHRLFTATLTGRGISLHRKEVALAAAVVALTIERIESDAVIHQLTEDEEQDGRPDDNDRD